MPWNIVITDAFSKAFKKYKKNQRVLNALDKKIERLKEAPHGVGGYLSGTLHGHKSTRLVKKMRLIFKIADEDKTVFLVGIDHRKFDYENF